MGNLCKISKDDFNGFISGAVKNFEVWAPAENNGKVSYKIIEDPREVRRDFIRCTQGAKKIFHPPKNLVFDYTLKNGFTSKEDTPVKDIMVLGLHGCDFKGVLLLDKVFADSEVENLYLKRRRNSVIVSLICDDCDKYCFCACMDSGPDISAGFDILLTDIGSDYLVEIGTQKGGKLLEGVRKTEAGEADIDKKKEKLSALRKKMGSQCGVDCKTMKDVLRKNFNHDYWQKESDRCLSCGSCTNVCPTCFCYSITDNLDWDGKTTKRELYWDSCQNKEFAQVAMGENFRPERIARLKQFVNHKLNYWHDQFGVSGCVGCGRCMEICPAEISLLDIVEKINK